MASDYEEELKKKMEIVDKQILTCPWCKSQNYTIKEKEPWYRRVKCNDCKKHFVRYDFNDKEGTFKIIDIELKKEDLPVRTPYGYNIYEFYAIAKGSGNLHIADATDNDFDEEGFMTGFSTECGRDIDTWKDHNWPKKWVLFLRNDTEGYEKYGYKTMCLKCRKIR
jgi:hypothetical protein